MFKTLEPAKGLSDAIRLMGIPYVVNLVMIHSLKSLFIVQNSKLKELFAISWKRLALKAATSRFLAKKLGFSTPDEAFIASLLSEAGTLAILSALSNEKQVPDQLTYLRLCRHYSKSLGTIILRKWNMEERYIDIAHNCGQWNQNYQSGPVDVSDIVNLSLYHSICFLKKDHQLPELSSLGIYQRLPKSLNLLDQRGLLRLISSNLKEIVDAAQEMY